MNHYYETGGVPPAPWFAQDSMQKCIKCGTLYVSVEGGLCGICARAADLSKCNLAQEKQEHKSRGL